jgi:hypothetical protein
VAPGDRGPGQPRTLRYGLDPNVRWP